MGAATLIDLLKRHLKAHGITYAKVAERLGLSEASVKRMFSRHDFTLQRLEDVCRVVDLDFVALARALSDEQASATHLTVEQEQEIISDPKLFLIALCAVGNWTLEQIIALYNISRVECIGYLAHLDKLRIIDLMPENRIRPLIGRTLTWLPDGPFQRYFRSRVEAEYLGSRFDRPNELFLFLNGMLSTKSAAELIARMRNLAAEFEEMHRDDLALAIGQRHGTSVLLACPSVGAEALSCPAARTARGGLSAAGRREAETTREVASAAPFGIAPRYFSVFSGLRTVCRPIVRPRACARNQAHHQCPVLRGVSWLPVRWPPSASVVA